MVSARFFLCIASLLASVFGVSFAAAPKTLTYQGKLTSPSGVAVNDTVDMIFELYNSPTGGTSYWTEHHPAVPVQHGLFSVVLGDDVPLILDFDEQYYLQITVDGHILAPRTRLTGSAYALRALVADSVAGGRDNLSDDSLGDLGDVDVSAADSGYVLKWDGSLWVPAPDNEATQNIFAKITDGVNTYAASSPTDSIRFVGVGGTAVEVNPTTGVVAINGNAEGFVHSVSATGGLVNIGNEDSVVITISDMGADSSDLLMWNGSSWTPGQPSFVRSVTAFGGIVAAGTQDSVVLSLSDMGADSGQVLSWDGSQWSPWTVSGFVRFVDGADGIVATGTADSVILSLSDMGADSGEVLFWNGSQWAPGLPNLPSLIWEQDSASGGVHLLPDSVVPLTIYSLGDSMSASLVQADSTTTGEWYGLYVSRKSHANADGKAIYGYAGALSGVGTTNEFYGVYGKAGYGARNYGVYGDAEDVGTGEGYGVYGRGKTYAVYGFSESGYGCYFDAPKNYFSGNVGIGPDADDPGCALKVRGRFDLKYGSSSVCIGEYACDSLVSAVENVAVGISALRKNDNSNGNTAVGASALYSLRGSLGENTAIGAGAFDELIDGRTNAGCGAYTYWGLKEGNSNTACGAYTYTGLKRGSYNTACGALADGVDTMYYNTTALGYGATVTDDNQVRIGNSSVTSIGGYANWTNLSDGRFKKDVREDVPGLVFIRKLRPITYHLDVRKLNEFLGAPDSMYADSFWTSAITQKEAIVQSGFIAQEVEEAAKSVGYDFSGVDAPKDEHDLYGLRYAEFVVPLVKAVQELDKQNSELRRKIEAQQKRIDDLEARIEMLESNLSE